MMQQAPIAITLGDPCGIGPEIILKSFDEGLPAPALVIGDPALLDREAQRLGLSLKIVALNDTLTLPTGNKGEAVVPVLHEVTVPPDLSPGCLDSRGGEVAYRCIVRAAALAMRGQVRAVVTAPLNKEAMHRAGHHYPGHTELLAELAGNLPVRMMLANDELRTVLVTIHLPLREALTSLTRERVGETIDITHCALQRAGIAQPRIAVAGVNPHAGEGGAFGNEELEILAPAIADARARQIDAQGPLAPDTVFMRARGFREFDVVIAMYHDQGLIPVKYLGLDQGVNITIGLPYVRTSPDHGTAFDIAGRLDKDGRGLADPGSLLAAFRQADRLSAISAASALSQAS